MYLKFVSFNQSRFLTSDGMCMWCYMVFGGKFIQSLFCFIVYYLFNKTKYFRIHARVCVSK